MLQQFPCPQNSVLHGQQNCLELGASPGTGVGFSTALVAIPLFIGHDAEIPPPPPHEYPPGQHPLPQQFQLDGQVYAWPLKAQHLVG
mmetsp:Transcript_38686/g.62668  ORF Transcript_38686/g.62668 Transcript_38686/m.62668 type:complete len:87 (-) Transcript_38686:562-822(-)